MADLNSNQAASTTKIVGSDSSGVETTPVKSNTAGELTVNDTPNSLGLDVQLALTTTAVEAKVGVSAKENRKYVVIEALTNNVKWGYTSACLFNCFRNQTIFIPAGESCTIYIKSSTGTADAIVGES